VYHFERPISNPYGIYCGSDSRSKRLMVIRLRRVVDARPRNLARRSDIRLRITSIKEYCAIWKDTNRCSLKENAIEDLPAPARRVGSCAFGCYTMPVTDFPRHVPHIRTFYAARTIDWRNFSLVNSTFRTAALNARLLTAKTYVGINVGDSEKSLRKLSLKQSSGGKTKKLWWIE